MNTTTENIRKLSARQRVERQIIRQIVKDGLARGYAISVFDGEEKTVIRTRSLKAVMDAIMTTDEDYLTFHRPSDDEGSRGGYEIRQIGWVRLIYGNDGWDVVNDYSTNLEPMMANANALADRLGG